MISVAYHETLLWARTSYVFRIHDWILLIVLSRVLTEAIQFVVANGWGREPLAFVLDSKSNATVWDIDIFSPWAASLRLRYTAATFERQQALPRRASWWGQKPLLLWKLPRMMWPCFLRCNVEVVVVLRDMRCLWRNFVSGGGFNQWRIGLKSPSFGK